MREIFADTPQAIDNTQIIADMCNFDFEFGHINSLITKHRIIWTILNISKCFV